MHTASAPIRPRKPFPDRLVRGMVLVFLSFFLLQLKVLASLVRFGISALRKPLAGSKSRRAE